MKIFDSIVNLLSKFKGFLAYIAGYFYGKKVQKLSMENLVYEKQKKKTVAQLKKDREIIKEWAGVRNRIVSNQSNAKLLILKKKPRIKNKRNKSN